jgi:hypothetical protein
VTLRGGSGYGGKAVVGGYGGKAPYGGYAGKAAYGGTMSKAYGGYAGKAAYGGSGYGGKAVLYGGFGGMATGGVSSGGSNTGGASLQGGTVASGGSQPSCVTGATVGCTCFDGSSGAQECRADGTYAPCRCLLTETRQRLIGKWAGTRQSSWDGEHAVTLEFFSDGHYSAQCADDCVVLYWGSNTDSPEKTYLIAHVNADGIGFGMIAIWFGPGNWRPGSIEALTLSADGNTLSFSVWYDTYGPLVFKLTRA